MPFYRNKLQLEQNQFVFREPGIAPHQEVYLKGTVIMCASTLNSDLTLYD